GRANREVISFDLSDAAFSEKAANDGSISGVLKIYLTGDKFASPGSDLTFGVDYLIPSLPPSFTPTLTQAADGTTAYLTLTGSTTDHNDVDDLTALSITWQPSAFSDASTATILNTLGGTFTIDFDADLIPSIDYAIPVNISSFKDNVSFDVSSEELNATDVTFSSDGMKFYLLGNTSDNIFEYTLSSPFDIQTAALTATFNLTFEENFPTGLALNASGSRLYVIGSTSDLVHEIILETPYDLSTAALSGVVLDISGEETTPTGITFSQNGNFLYIIGSATDNIYQYDLTSPYDLSTASFSGKIANVGDDVLAPSNLRINRTGTQVFVSGTSTDRIFTYNLGIAFDIGTATFSNESISLAAIDNVPEGFDIDPSGTRLFVIGTQFDRVYEFSTVNFAFQEQSANDGSVAGSLLVFPEGDRFALTSGSLTEATDYTIDNLPAGLIPDLEVFNNGDYAVLTLTGNATANDNADDLSSLRFTFLDAAFSSLVAADLADAVAAESNLGINFTINPVPAISYSLPVLITTARQEDSFPFTSEDTTPNAITFSNDGTRLYMLGNTSRNIYEYLLSTAYDITTASLNSQLDFSFEETVGNGITFNREGTKLFIIGSFRDDVIEYQLTEPFELNTASLTGVRFNVNSEDATPVDVTFSKDGMRMYMLGSTNDNIYQYDLPAPFEVSGATYGGVSQSVTSTAIAPTALQFNENGTRLFVVGTSSDRLHSYSLSIPFDLATMADEELDINLSAVDNFPNDIFIDPTGTKLFMVGLQNDELYSFNLTETAFWEKEANDGSVEGSLQINITGDTFTNQSGFLTDVTDFTVENIQVGLVPSIAVSADGTFATLTLSGNSTLHDDANDESELVITFSNSAFAGGDATAITKAIGGSSGFALDFTANEKSLNYSINPDMTTAEHTDNFFVGNEESNATGLAFNNDGTRMYISGSSTDQVYEYILSVNFEVTTAVFSTSLNTFSEELGISHITFNRSGSRLYLTGQNSKKVHEYLLEEPFVLSSAAYTGTNFDISSQVTAPTGFTFNRAGTGMYVLGTSTDNLYRYNLSIPFDISTAVFSGDVLDISGQFLSANDISFNENGTIMYITGNNNRQLGTYNLSTPFDINTAVFAGNSINFLDQDNSPQSMVFEPSGTKLFMLGATEDSVYTYQFSDIAFAEPALNDGSVEGEILIGITGGSFTNTGGQLSDYTIDNLPEGLIPELTVSDDGLSASLVFTGNATEQAELNSLSNIQFSFGNASFLDADATSYTNASGFPADFQLLFTGPLPPLNFQLIEVSQTQIDLDWTDQAEDETEYAIFRSDGDNLGFVEIATVAADETSYSDISITADNSYFYYVVTRNADGDSSPTQEKAASTLISPGNALAFDGLDDFVSVSDLNALSGNFTLEAWVRYTGSGVGFETIIEFGNDNPWLGLSAGSLNAFGFLTDPNEFLTDVWKHVAVS
ncbi:MAG: hypothetical protein WBA74_07505, partial [Cyclobacteriaceae bacterium]